MKYLRLFRKRDASTFGDEASASSRGDAETFGDEAGASTRRVGTTRVSEARRFHMLGRSGRFDQRTMLYTVNKNFSIAVANENIDSVHGGESDKMKFILIMYFVLKSHKMPVGSTKYEIFAIVSEARRFHIWGRSETLRPEGGIVSEARRFHIRGRSETLRPEAVFF
jgi:hypothetical protein